MKIGMKMLMISRKAKQCGVSDYGKRLYAILQKYFDIDYREVNGIEDCKAEGYNIVLWNYHYATLPFVTNDTLQKGVKHFAIFHEAALNFTPDKVIDTSIRPLFEVEFPEVINPVPVIGSFGFGFPDKNFSRIAEMVKEQFTEAVIRLNIPFAEYGDRDGFLARREADKVRGILAGTNIQLVVNHDYLSQTDLLTFLNGNDINLFMYAQSHGRGLSSAIDYALSVKKPIGVSDSEMFRHLPESLRNTDIKWLIENSVNELQGVYKTHSNRNLVNKFAAIFI